MNRKCNEVTTELLIPSSNWFRFSFSFKIFYFDSRRWLSKQKWWNWKKTRFNFCSFVFVIVGEYGSRPVRQRPKAAGLWWHMCQQCKRSITVCVCAFFVGRFFKYFSIISKCVEKFLKSFEFSKIFFGKYVWKEFYEKKQQRSKNRIKISNVLNIQSNNTKLVTRTYKITYKKMSRKKIYKK